MNAVEIEEAISVLATEPFDRAEFPYKFRDFDKTIKALEKKGSRGLISANRHAACSRSIYPLEKRSKMIPNITPLRRKFI